MGEVVAIRPYEATADVMISATIRACAAARALPIVDVAAKIGMSRTSFYNRLSGVSEWRASEVKTIADLFGVSVADLYTGFDGRVGPSDPMTNGSRLGESNPGPSHYKSHDPAGGVHGDALATVRDIDTAPSLRDDVDGPVITRRQAS